MKRGSDQATHDPGDHTSVLRVYLRWAASTAAALASAGPHGEGHIARQADGSFQLAFAVQRGPTPTRPTFRQRHFALVDPTGELADRWTIVRLGPGVWDVVQSIYVEGQIHAFVTIVGVPEPAPWEEATGQASGRGDFTKSARWLREHRAEHAGEWVALLGDELIVSERSRATLQKRIADRPDLRDLLVVQIEGTEARVSTPGEVIAQAIEDAQDAPDLAERIARARMAFHKAVDDELYALSDEELKAYVGEENIADAFAEAERDSDWFDRFYKRRAQSMVHYRWHLARARASGADVYCVYHAQDRKLCPHCPTCDEHLAVAGEDCAHENQPS